VKKNCVIDSNEKMEQLMTGFSENNFTPDGLPKNIGEDTAFVSKNRSEKENISTDTSLSAGNIINMEDLRQQEREKISQQNQETIRQLLQQANEESERIVNQAKDEAERIRQKAYDEGKTAGFMDGNQKAQEQLQQEYQEKYQALEQDRALLKKQEQELEPRFADVMVSLLGKLTGILCQDQKEVILYLIREAMQNLERTSQIQIKVSHDDLDIVSAQKENLQDSMEQEVPLEIVEDASLLASQCVIETDHQILDCSLDVQLNNLKKQIQFLTMQM
jgi:flagellar assembly protein FliH